MKYRVLTFPLDDAGTFFVPEGLELFQVLEVSGNANRTARVIVRLT